jgi:hypothetical protein
MVTAYSGSRISELGGVWFSLRTAYDKIGCVLDGYIDRSGRNRFTRSTLAVFRCGSSAELGDYPDYRLS